jgi:hypothetical protein
MQFAKLSLVTLVAFAASSIAFACKDVTGKFQVFREDTNTFKMKKCKQIKKNPWGQCAKPEVRENCPVTCNACPSDVACRIKADLQFPQAASEITAYHKDSVQVEKVGSNDACFSGNTKTSWGCTHVGDAFFDTTSNAEKFKERESVRIFNGNGGEYRISVSHVFTEEEVLLDIDQSLNSRANLIVKVNGKRLSKSFRHNRNNIKNTHTDYSIVYGENDPVVNENVGFVNPTYNGDYFVDVKCNNKCQCTVARVDAKCRLLARLTFPTIDDQSDYGYHSDILTIFNEDNEECSYEKNVTSWCQSYGDAILYSAQSGFYDFNMAYAANIPDAAGKTFDMNFEHYKGPNEAILGYYPRSSDLKLYANGAEFFSIAGQQGNLPIRVSCNNDCACSTSILPLA